MPSELATVPDRPEMPLVPSKDAVLAFYTLEGFAGGMQKAGLTAEEVFSTIADIAKNGKTDIGRLAAVKLFFERADFVLRLERVLPEEGNKGQLHLHLHEADGRKEGTAEHNMSEVERVERELAREIRAMAPSTSGPVIDIEEVLPSGEDQDKENDSERNPDARDERDPEYTRDDPSREQPPHGTAEDRPGREAVPGPLVRPMDESY